MRAEVRMTDPSHPFIVGALWRAEWVLSYTLTSQSPRPEHPESAAVSGGVDGR